MTSFLPTALEGQRLAVVDVEGNGQQPPEIIEIAVLPLDDETTHEPQTWLVRPNKPIATIVTQRVHGISNTDVADCPPWSAVAPEVEKLLAGRTLIGHNVSVEIKVLTAHLPGWSPPMALDTLRLAKRVFPDIAGGYSLTNLVKQLSLDITGPREQRSHRAEFDAWCTWKLLLLAIGHGKLTYDDLVAHAAPPGFADPQGGLW